MCTIVNRQVEESRRKQLAMTVYRHTVDSTARVVWLLLTMLPSWQVFVSLLCRSIVRAERSLCMTIRSLNKFCKIVPEMLSKFNLTRRHAKTCPII